MTRGPKRQPLMDRLLRYRDIAPDGCWNWAGPTNNCGYGTMSVREQAGQPKPKGVHRVSYEEFVGPIPDGLQIDHPCRNRLCFNPDHLEPVTVRENLLRSPIAPAGVNARKTHCPQGHEYTPENTYRNRVRGRTCKTCSRNRARSKQVTA